MTKELEAPEFKHDQELYEKTARPQGWLGMDDRVFPYAQPMKKWTKPKAPASSASSPRRMHQDWLGGYSSPEFSPSYSARNEHPQQIQIDGAKSIKESPFFKNFNNL